MFVFLHLYELEERIAFGWDQVQNSWVMKDMIIDHKFPLEGMVARANSGFYIGPAYYYLLAPFYYLFRLDPIANGYFAATVAIGTFTAVFLVIKKLFTTRIALLAIALYTFSSHIVFLDRVSWPVVFIPVISILIFYYLYQSIVGKTSNLLFLAAVVGFSFHFHFTAIFYPIIVVLAIPLLIYKRDIVKYALLSLPIFVAWFIPNILAGINNGFSAGNNIVQFANVYFHGFHLVRFKQLLPDAFIQLESILYFKELRIVSFLLLPIFMYMYYRRFLSKRAYSLLYLSCLWFIVPWIVFTTYSGEITDYYFSLTIPIAVMIIAYLSDMLLQNKFLMIRVLTAAFWIFYAVTNLYIFWNAKNPTLPIARKNVQQAIQRGETIDFKAGNPEAYLYYVQMLNKEQKVR